VFRLEAVRESRMLDSEHRGNGANAQSVRLGMVLQPEDSVKRKRSARGRVEGSLRAVEAVLHPLVARLQPTARPSPPPVVAQTNLFLHAPLAVPGELLLLLHKGTFCTTARNRPAAACPFMPRCKHVALLQSAAACVQSKGRPASQGPSALSTGASCLIGRPHTLTESLLWPIYRRALGPHHVQYLAVADSILPHAHLCPFVQRGTRNSLQLYYVVVQQLNNPPGSGCST
jgi:hypothetical protein